MHVYVYKSRFNPSYIPVFSSSRPNLRASPLPCLISSFGPYPASLVPFASG